MTEKDQVVKNIKWYLKPVSIIMALLCVGPFALPLVWLTPLWKKKVKVAITVLAIIFTVLSIQAGVRLYDILKQEMEQLQAILKQ